MNYSMKKIITTVYLLFIVVILNGCETSQSLKTETKEKLLSFETKLITNSGPVVGYVDSQEYTNGWGFLLPSPLYKN